MTLSDLLEAAEIQGSATVAVYDFDKEEYTVKHNTYNLPCNKYIRHRYGDYIVRFIYNGDDNYTVIEITKE